MQFSIEHDLDKNSNKLLIILVFADIVFIVLHTLHHDTGLLPSSLFSLAQERGYGEMYQYIKEFWIVVLLFILAITRLNFLYVAWALLFVYLLLDDSFQIHERGGVFLANYLNLEPKYGLQAEEFGQLFISIFFGGFFLAIIGVSHYLSNVSDRIISKYLFIMLIILIFFGIILDMILQLISLFKGVYGRIEEGGELFVMSIITWYVFSINGSEKGIPNSDKQ